MNALRSRASICLLAASLSGAAWAGTNTDPFDDAVRACASPNLSAIDTTMTMLDATAMSDDMIDRLKLSQSIGLAYQFIHGQMSQGDIDTQAVPNIQFKGWMVDRMTVMVMSGTGTAERMCSVFVPYDKYDAAVALISGPLGKGQPAKTLGFSGRHVAAWDVDAKGFIPGEMVLSADFGGEHKPTTVQIVTK